MSFVHAPITLAPPTTQLTLLLCVQMMKGCLVGPLEMTQVRLSVEPLLRNTSLGPRIVVLGAVTNNLTSEVSYVS